MKADEMSSRLNSKLSAKYEEWVSRSRMQSIKSFAALLVVIVLVLWSSQFLRINFDRLLGVWHPLYRMFTIRMFPPELSYIPGRLVASTLETIQMAIVGTFIGIFLSIFISWFAAKNVTPFYPYSYWLGRGVATFSRSLHAIVWGMLMVAIFGFGTFPGVIALIFITMGTGSKLMAEAAEAIDASSLEAIKAVGANKAQIFYYGVLPQVKPYWIGIAIWRWDVALRSSAILGLVGAGGIGLYLNSAISRLQFRRVSAILIVIVSLVILSEYVSAYLRQKVT